jgi:Mrp family chromosome partitioning ATPase/DUF971 family protein
VLEQLSKVLDPDLNTDIVSLGFVKEMEMTAEGEVSFVLELTTPACPVKDDLQRQCVERVEQLPWVKSVDVTLSAQPHVQSGQQRASGLSKVKNVIAVSSCKGGVGKSTTAVNLAFALKQSGASVGIIDADIYGPSLPTMVRPEDTTIRFVENQIQPLEFRGVKLMSFGYLNPGAAIMRGPMVTQLLNQFVSLTSWGELDYLVVDMPPGTGDIPLTLCQLVNITAAVIVTTPQRMSFVDVVKGIDMFDTVNVPCVAVVENMASYSTYDTDTIVKEFLLRVPNALSSASIAEKALREAVQASRVQRKLFGAGHAARLRSMWGIEALVSVPLLEDVSTAGDSGTPLVISHSNTPGAECFRDLAQRVVRETAKVKHAEVQAPTLAYDAKVHQLSFNGSHIPPAMLRRACRCAACVEEMTGRPILDPASVSEAVKPLGTAPIGRYAISVDWSDGHKSLYPFKTIQSVCEFENKKAQAFA